MLRLSEYEREERDFVCVCSIKFLFAVSNRWYAPVPRVPSVSDQFWSRCAEEAMVENILVRVFETKFLAIIVNFPFVIWAEE